MGSRQPTRSKNYKKVEEQLRDGTPTAVLELIATQLDRADDAAERISREGSVVRDPRGTVIPHPAIQIEIGATKLAADLFRKYQDTRPGL
mgnify:CR=1 FL=1